MRPLITKHATNLFTLGIKVGYRRAAAAVRWDSCDDTRPGFQEHGDDLAAMLTRAAEDATDPDDPPGL